MKKIKQRFFYKKILLTINSDCARIAKFDINFDFL